MFVTQILGPLYWADEPVAVSEWREIEEVFAQLDADNASYLGLMGQGDFPCLAIGGGRGRYFVSFRGSPELPEFVLCSGTSMREVSLVVGGQDIDIPENYVSDAQLAKSAARHFAETGEMLGRLEWQAL